MALNSTMVLIQRLRTLHAAWAETLAAWPAADDGQVGQALRTLTAYAEDLTRYSRSVSSLAEAIRQKAQEGEAAPSLPPAPSPTPAVAASP